MKILKFKAENFKKLSVVEITPDGNVVIISGKNAAGKSSVLDGIEAALRGGRCLPKQPIKTGEHRAKVEAELGDKVPEYKVTRKFLGTTSTLKVETVGETKSEIRSPQTFLDKVVGDISFDPLAFMKKTSAEQRDALMEFLGLNLDEFDNKVASLKTERSDVRKAKERMLHVADSLTFTPNLPEVEQGADPLLAKLQAIRDHNESCQAVETENAVLQSRLQGVIADVRAAKKAVQDWQVRLTKLQTLQADLERELGSHLEILWQDPAEVEDKIKALGDTNEAIRRNNQKRQAVVDYEIHCSAYRDLGDEVKQVEGQKARKMAEAVMPVEGLTIQSDGLAYGGIPLGQVNSAKQLEVCVAISMAMNPELKVLRIDGNALDTESLLTIGKLVDNQGYQVWIEKVSDDNTIGFYIEDGQLVNEKALQTFSEKVVPLVTEGLPEAINEALTGDQNEEKTN